MSVRRLAEDQPASFAFTPENKAWADKEIAKYPPGRQASAVISLLWIGQEQQGWVTHPMIETVGRRLDMAFIRVLEVATFYTMFNLHPVGKYHLQVCTTPPCLLRGSDDVVKACEKHIGHAQMAPTADGMKLVGADGQTVVAFGRWSNSLFVTSPGSGVSLQLRRGR